MAANPGFHRDVKAATDAFLAGLRFEPPAISPDEYREALRMVGYPLRDTDDLDPPQIDWAALRPEDNPEETEETDGDEPA